MRQKKRYAAAAVVMTLLGASATVAELPPDGLFKGGGYDGYSRQIVTAMNIPSPMDWLFIGGGYDGYARQIFGNATIPPGPLRGTMLRIF